MLGGFKCSKNTLIGLNAFYIIIGIVLIGIGSHWITANTVTSLPIIGGVVACGVFLILISTVGILGASRHHQVLLFFYMVILFIVFLIQFSVACACLSVSDETQHHIAHKGWKSLDMSAKKDVQLNFECCGFDSVNNTGIEKGMEHPDCFLVKACITFAPPKTCNSTSECCTDAAPDCACKTCSEKLDTVIGTAFRTAGGVSLFFSFTEIIGAVLVFAIPSTDSTSGTESLEVQEPVRQQLPPTLTPATSHPLEARSAPWDLGPKISDLYFPITSI